MQLLGTLQLDQGDPAFESHNRADFIEDLALESERLVEPGEGGADVGTSTIDTPVPPYGWLRRASG
jgi:hypothetical protein